MTDSFLQIYFPEGKNTNQCSYLTMTGQGIVCLEKPLKSTKTKRKDRGKEKETNKEKERRKP
jgi:hypothetical protein